MRFEISLRLKFILYLICAHLLFAGTAVFLLLQHPLWLIAVEAVFIVSLCCGISLLRGLFVPIHLISNGAEFIQDADFNSRFRKTGHPEMDCLIGVYNRMADHLRQERIRIQEQNYFLEKILAVSPSGILTFDFDGKIAMVNPTAERMIQIPAAELVARTLTQIQSPFLLNLVSLRVGESKIVPLVGRRRVKCHRSQFLDRGFMRDFILIEELTEELRIAEKNAYETAIRMMSHEVNNSIGSANSLLHSCLNYSGQLAGEDRQDFENALNIVISRTDRLNTFMRKFADVFRFPKPLLKRADIKELLEEAAALFERDLANRNIALKWEIRQEIPPVLLDKSQMDQVFINIMKNSIEAIGNNGTITLRLGIRNDFGYVVIEDTGSGISPAVLPNLFTPFFSTKKNGQGIGLTLVQEILDAHAFKFSLESEKDQPTRFTIFFAKSFLRCS